MIPRTGRSRTSTVLRLPMPARPASPRRGPTVRAISTGYSSWKPGVERSHRLRAAVQNHGRPDCRVEELVKMTSEAAYVAPERAHAQEAGGVSFGRDLPMGRFLLAIPLPTWLAALFDRLLPNSLPQGAQVRLTQYFQSLFKFLRAIAIAASPWLGSVHITAVLASVRVFNAEQIKIPLPKAFLPPGVSRKSRLQSRCRRHLLRCGPSPYPPGIPHQPRSPGQDRQIQLQLAGTFLALV